MYRGRLVGRFRRGGSRRVVWWVVAIWVERIGGFTTNHLPNAPERKLVFGHDAHPSRIAAIAKFGEQINLDAMVHSVYLDSSSVLSS